MWLFACMCVTLINSKFLHIRGEKDVLSTTSSCNTIQQHLNTNTHTYLRYNSSTKHIQFIILSLWGVLAAFRHCWQLLALRDSCGASHCVCVRECGAQQDRRTTSHFQTHKNAQKHTGICICVYVFLVGSAAALGVATKSIAYISPAGSSSRKCAVRFE